MNGTTTNGAAASIAIGGAQIREVAARAIVWLWHQLVCDGQIVVLFGAPGSGKTTLLFPDARRRTRVERRGRCARATRRARARRQVRRADRRRARRSVAARKLVKTAEVLGIDRQEVDPLDRVILIARKEVRVGSPKWEEIKQLIARGLVADLFIDSLARFGAGESNSEDDQADSFAEVSAAIEGAPSCTKATAWIIAHARKSADGGVEGLSGSTQRAAQADTILFVKATTDDNDQVCSSRVTAPKLRGEPDEPFKAVDFTIAKNEAGRWSCTLDGASKRTEKQAPAHERVHTLLATAPEPMTKSAMRDALGMSGKVIEEAITALFATKQITRVGEGKGARFAAKTKGIESAHGIARATSVVGVLPRSRRRTTDEPAPDNTRRRCPLDALRTRHFRCPVSGAVPSGNRGRNDDRTRPLHRTGRTTGSQKGIRCPVRRFFQSARRADRRALRQREARAARGAHRYATSRAPGGSHDDDEGDGSPLTAPSESLSRSRTQRVRPQPRRSETHQRCFPPPRPHPGRATRCRRRAAPSPHRRHRRSARRAGRCEPPTRRCPHRAIGLSVRSLPCAPQHTARDSARCARTIGPIDPLVVLQRNARCRCTAAVSQRILQVARNGGGRPSSLPDAPGRHYHRIVPRIFVSSTCYDLVDLRKEVEEHLRSLGLQPVMSDQACSDFEVSPNADSIECCLVNVRDSDVFVCVLSQRYGPPLDDFGYPGLSATHVEYLEARKRGMRILFYVRDRTGAEHGLWRKDKANFKPRWVREPKLFEFLEAHQAPPAAPGATTTNWFTAFRDSVDLKQILSKDLRAQSKPALLRRLIDSGRVPFLDVTFKQAHQQNPHLVVHVQIRGVSGCWPLRVEASATRDGAAGFNSIELGDLPGGKVAGYPVFFALPTDASPNPTAMLRIRHETEYAHVVADTFALTWWSAQGRLERRLIKRELLDELSYELA